ncbi:MAG TPA: phosphotransferase, partial [Acidimicrobiales bacterium]
TGIELRNYEREVRFYQQIRDTVHIRTPHCWYAEWDPESGDFTLLLEDLAPAVQGDQVAGCSLDHARLGIVELAKLHAPRWGDPGLDDIEWLSRRGAESGPQLQALYAMVFPGFVETYGPRLTAEQVALAERFTEKIPAWIAMHHPPFCVTHGDYRLDNMMFGTEQGGYPVAVVDWQTPGHGSGSADLSYFIGAGLLPHDRRTHERDLVAEYHGAMLVEGVTDLTFDDLWDDYVRDSFAGVVMAVVASMIVGKSERSEDMFHAMAERHLQHALDLDALSMIP